jgi:Flp pilus assembly protein TadG
MSAFIRAFAGCLARQDGGATVETALCMPVLVLLLAGIVDFGRFSQCRLVVASSAHAGAQYGSQSSITAQDISGMEAAATNDAPNVTASAFSYYVCATGSPPATTYSGQTMAQQRIIQNGCATTHQLLYVVVSTTTTFTPFFLSFLNNPVKSTVVMQVPT